MRKQGLMLMVFGLGIAVGCFLSRSEPSRTLAQDSKSEITGKGAEGESKPATDATKKANAAFAMKLPFADKQAFTDAQKGFIATLSNRGLIKGKAGATVWDFGRFSFINLDKQSPDSDQPEPLAAGAAPVLERPLQDQRRYLPPEPRFALCCWGI